MRIFVTGGAGFVGSNLVERLIAEGHSVTAYDNLSAGSRFFLHSCEAQPGFRFIEADLLDLATLCQSVASHDVVFHLAANSDITASRLQSDLDLRLGTIAAYNVLEAMRRSDIRKIAFSSSSVVYGEPSVVPTREDYGPLLPISLYGASKLACEGWQKAEAQLNYFNLGCQGGTRVAQIAESLLKILDLHDAKIICTGGARGWIGDVPQVRLDCAKLETLGWKAQMTSDEAVRLATMELAGELACK